MPGSIEVARTDQAVYVRVSGLGNFNNAGPLREYCEKAINEGVRCVIVDLGPCTGLDSTFMGTLMGLLNYECSGRPASVSIVNATPATLRAMNSLGLPKILPVKPEPVAFPECRLEALREGWQDKRRRTLLIRDAHVALMRADKENENRFAPFVAALVKEVHEMEEQMRGE